MSIDREVDDHKKDDLTGKKRLVWNVVTGWGSYIIVVITGFVLPRSIDHFVGQASLGIWDFCWSLVNYLRLAHMGLGSSANRYVAKYRTNNKTEDINKLISSVVILELFVSFIVVIVTVVAAYYLPMYYSHTLGDSVYTARWVLLFLGFSLGVHFLCGAFRGVITGCHRWDINNAINTTSNIIVLIGMITAMVLGGGLYWIAFIYFLVAVLTEISRVILAFYILPELKLKLGYFQKSYAKEIFIYGSKTIISGFPLLLLVQTTNVLIVGMIGPAALAVFSRPIALVRFVQTFLNSFALVLTPTTGALQAKKQSAEINNLLLETVRIGMSITLPMILLLAIYGDVLLRLWMGDDYANWPVIAILSLGYLLPLSQGAVLTILAGMNWHGRAALLNLILVSVCYFILLGCVFYFGWSLLVASLLVAIPLTIGNGIFIPFYACRKLGISKIHYIKYSILSPLLYGSVFAISLIACRFSMKDTPILAMLTGAGLGSLMIVVIYWKYLFKEQHRQKILKLLKLL